MSGPDDAPNTDDRVLLLLQSLQQLRRALKDVEDLAAVAQYRTNECVAIHTVSVRAETSAVLDYLHTVKDHAFRAEQRVLRFMLAEERTP